MEPRTKEYQPQDHQAQDDAFTIQVTTNDKYFVEVGGAQEHKEYNGRGYILFVFEEDGNCTTGQGVVNVGGIMEGLLNLYPVEKLKRALAEAALKSMLEKMMGEGN